MTRMRFVFLLLAVLCASAISHDAHAQEGNTQEPVSIEATNRLEWIQDQFLYRATGDVVITQGRTSIKAQQAEARYDPEQGPSSINTVTATGSVVMSDGKQVIYADRAEYDTRTTVLTLHGAPVRLVSGQQTVTAKGGMTYDTAKRIARATGGAVVEDEGRTLKADTITAWLNADGKALQRATATGRVVITHRAQGSKNKNADIAQADSATYDAARNTVELKGNVKLTRDTNHMQGQSARVDLKTGHSTLQSDPASGGRVRAIFTPGDGGTPLPQVSGAVPMVPGKRNPEMPYQVGSGKKIDHVQ